MSEQIDLTNNGSWNWYDRPHAVIYNDKLYYSYLDDTGQLYVKSYDFETGDEESNMVYDHGTQDVHEAMPVLVRPDEYLQVFIGGDSEYGNDLAWKVSDNPEDITSFGDLQRTGLIQDDYFKRRFEIPMIHEDTDDIYHNFFINDADRDESDEVKRHIGLVKSTDNGDTWEEDFLVHAISYDMSAEDNRAYTASYMEGDEIHFVTARIDLGGSMNGENIGRVESIHYIKYDVTTEEFKTADGTVQATKDDAPIEDQEKFDNVWDWEDDGDGELKPIWSDIMADDDGTPYIGFGAQEIVSEGTSSLHDAYWAKPDEQGNWEYTNIVKTARGWGNKKPELVLDNIKIDPRNPYQMYICVSVDEGEDTSRLERWVSEDEGDSWEMIEEISGTGRVTGVKIPWIYDDSPRRIDALWLEGSIEEWADYSTNIQSRLKSILARINSNNGVVQTNNKGVIKTV